MKTLPLIVVVVACVWGSSVSAQDKPGSVPVRCGLSDGTERSLEATVANGGRTYRCVETLDDKFQRSGVAWTQISPQPKPFYTSEAMLRRIGGGNAATSRGDVARCDLSTMNTNVSVDGRTYRCVEMLDGNFQPRGLVWTPVSPQP